jgi:hypothetical protein
MWKQAGTFEIFHPLATVSGELDFHAVEFTG